MNKHHLSLVTGRPPFATGDVHLTLRTFVEANGQLEMDLKDVDRRQFVIMTMDVVHGSRLTSVLDRMKPSTVADLRQTLRFDQPGSSRSDFFGHLARLRANYVRAPFAWPRDRCRYLAGDERLPHKLFHEAVERWDGSLFLLVSKVEQGRFLHALLNRTLSERKPGRWNIEQVV